MNLLVNFSCSGKRCTGEVGKEPPAAGYRRTYGRREREKMMEKRRGSARQRKAAQCQFPAARTCQVHVNLCIVNEQQKERCSFLNPRCTMDNCLHFWVGEKICSQVIAGENMLITVLNPKAIRTIMTPPTALVGLLSLSVTLINRNEMQ